MNKRTRYEDWDVFGRDFECPECNGQDVRDAGRVKGHYGRRRCRTCGHTFKVQPVCRMVNIVDSAGHRSVHPISWDDYFPKRNLSNGQLDAAFFLSSRTSTQPSRTQFPS